MLAIPVWDDQVSTTLDFARALVLVEVQGGREVSRKEVVLGDGPAAGKARKLRNLGVGVVLCGAVSQSLAQAVSGAGIQIVPYVSGPIDEVLGAYLCGRLSEPRFMQPGCRPGARRRWRHGCRGNGPGRHKRILGGE
jgi:predicted Fe-Mo cluster-binding NifX family protein